MSEPTAAATAEAATHVQILPDDGLVGTLVGRAWLGGSHPGPAVVALRTDGVFDLSRHFPTMSTLLDTPQPAEAARMATGDYLCSVAELLANSQLGAREVSGDTKIAKLSLVGIGMRSHAGVASRMFEALAKEGINIRMISTSEIKISVVVDEKYLELGVRALHEAFDLHKAT